MSEILYYPHYTPSISHLRTLLLFYDRVSSMVPMVDSQSVLAREHVAEMNKHFGQSTYKTIDTSWKFHAWAESDSLALTEFKSLFGKQKEKGKKLKASDLKILKEEAHSSDKRSKVISAYVRQGWRLIAAQKIPWQLLEDMEDASLAISLNAVISDKDGRTIEENPILMKGPLANFFLARLAREMAGETGLQTMTFDQGSYSSHALKDSADRAQVASEIALNVTLPIVVPPGIEALNVGYYAELRDEFRQTRDSLNTISDALSVRMGLNTAPNERVFLERVQDAHSDFLNAMHSAEQTMRKETYGKMLNGAFTVGASLVGTGLGFAFTNEVVGGLIGAGGGSLLSLLSSKQSTMVKDDYGDMAKQAVMARGKVGKQLATQNRVLQNHLGL